MAIDTDIRARDGTGIAAQWAANLLPPMAFLLELEVAYMLVPRACREGNVLLVHLAHAATLLIALAGVVLAWNQWQRWGTSWSDEGSGPEPRSRFMTTLGLLTGIGFTLVILALWLPSFVVHPCQ
jgi:hypothetical protein